MAKSQRFRILEQPDWCDVFALQGDGNIRYYELSTEKPYINFLTEYRSLLPQKGLGEING